MVFRVFRVFWEFKNPEKPKNPKLIKQIIYIDNKRLMILQSNSADILSDTLKKSAEIHVTPKINALFLITHQPFYKNRSSIVSLITTRTLIKDNADNFGTASSGNLHRKTIKSRFSIQFSAAKVRFFWILQFYFTNSVTCGVFVR